MAESNIPLIRNNDYESVTVPLITKSGETVGLEFKVCRKCGALVFNTKQHKSWHQSLGPYS